MGNLDEEKGLLFQKSSFSAIDQQALDKELAYANQEKEMLLMDIEDRIMKDFIKAEAETHEINNIIELEEKRIKSKKGKKSRDPTPNENAMSDIA